MLIISLIIYLTQLPLHLFSHMPLSLVFPDLALPHALFFIFFLISISSSWQNAEVPLEEGGFTQKH